MMAVTYRLKSSQISSRRIDPWHYQPEFFKKIAKVYSGLGGKELAMLIDNERGVAGGATPLGAEYLSNGRVRFYRTSEVDELQIDADNAVYITDEDDEKLRRSRLKDGDVLLTITGAKFGKSAVVNETHLPGNISQHSVRFFPKPDELDPYFLVAYMNGVTGQIAIWREAYGATRPAIDFPGVRSLVVPSVGNVAQKYIGDKVRQAERLRSLAKAKRDTINSYFNNLFGDITLDRPEKRSNRISLDILVTRLNAEYYSHEYVQVEIGLKRKFGKLSNIGQLAPTVRSKARPTEDCRYFEIGDLSIARGGFEEGTFYKKGEAPNNAQRKFDVGDVAVSTRRPNRGAIAVIEDNFPENFYSVFLARLKPKNIYFGYWLKEFLRHDAGKLLLQQRCTWTTYPVISEDDLETIPIPVLEQDWEKITELSRNSVFLDNLAKSLTIASKLLVEALIEGQLDESLLIAAQDQLQTGNDSFDRNIVSRLKTDGIDGKGQPLFADLDQLYSLLEQAERS